MGEAAWLFLRDGILPEDGLMREVVLANGEFVALLGHRCGDSDPEVLAAYDQIAIAEDAERDSAIKRMCATATEGRLVRVVCGSAKT